MAGSCLFERVPCSSAGTEVWAEGEFPILRSVEALTPLDKSCRLTDQLLTGSWLSRLP